MLFEAVGPQRSQNCCRPIIGERLAVNRKGSVPTGASVKHLQLTVKKKVTVAGSKRESNTTNNPTSKHKQNRRRVGCNQLRPAARTAKPFGQPSDGPPLARDEQEEGEAAIRRVFLLPVRCGGSNEGVSLVRFPCEGRQSGVAVAVRRCSVSTPTGGGRGIIGRDPVERRGRVARASHAQAVAHAAAPFFGPAVPVTARTPHRRPRRPPFLPEAPSAGTARGPSPPEMPSSDTSGPTRCAP